MWAGVIQLIMQNMQGILWGQLLSAQCQVSTKLPASKTDPVYKSLAKL